MEMHTTHIRCTTLQAASTGATARSGSSPSRGARWWAGRSPSDPCSWVARAGPHRQHGVPLLHLPADFGEARASREAALLLPAA